MKKKKTNKKNMNRSTFELTEKCVYVCVQGYWQVIDCALVRKSICPGDKLAIITRS